MDPVMNTLIAAAPIRIGAAAILGWSSYLTGLSGRCATPWTVTEDAFRYVDVLTDSAPPTWAHPWPIVGRRPLAQLRDCSLDTTEATDREQIPTLLLPPQAGTHSCIVDHSPDRSQVVSLRRGGLTRLHCLEWLPATPATDALSIDDHLDTVAWAVDRLGGRVHLVGDSQGGWLGTMFAALHPDAVHTLTVAGAPIDFHIDQPALTALDYAPTGAAAALIDLWYGAARAAGLQSTDPVREIERAFELLGVLADPDEVARIESERRWFAWRQEIPAAFREWIMRHLFAGNELVKGTLYAQGRRVDLSEISCPLFLLAGRADPLATPAQVTALAGHVSTPPGEIVTTIADTGHIGLFIGRRTQSEIWTTHARRLREYTDRTP